ncbi:hypothetical protein BDV96DRAFT_490454 [Lophiotrema nucula]|uniref:Rhodopsin domain-containing protein n=1 Tax=Lophiotrema nucula TaxID=690887 RepID=A0A6A5ZEZ2_9PLEO|nr:hypothetical protein BDV96DRAFT_490454 [Lophiotrema nucula]
MPDNSNLPTVNKPETVLGTTITFLSIAFIAISLRLIVRLRERIWGWDDLFVFLAGVSTGIGAIITCLMPGTGMGRHIWTLSEAQIMGYFKYIWSTNVTYTSSTTFIKLAILFQYLRLFDMQHSLPRRITIGMIIFVACWGITFFLLALFSCTPIEKNWNWNMPGHCVAWGSKNGNELFASFIAHSSSNMLLDVLILVLPTPFLKSLRARGKTRVGLIALFVMGGIVACLSIARIVALAIRRAGTVPVFDPTYAAPAVYIFSVLEINIAILCASTPIFWPLVTSLAANKILVVNEIEVHTSRRSSQDTAERGTFVDIGENGGRTSRMSVMISGKESRLGRSGSKLHRNNNPSTSSSNKGIELGFRPSQDSSRGLQLKPSKSSFVSADAPRSASMDHYSDRFITDWAVPDFDKDSKGGNGRVETYTTTVERAEIPFDHLKALEK